MKQIDAVDIFSKKVLRTRKTECYKHTDTRNAIEDKEKQ